MNRATSTYLDLARFAAATLVFLHHANYERLTGGLPYFWRFADLGHDAVMIFFVLSGFVIAYVANEKEHTLGDYAVSRLARLWSVALPALALTLLLDVVGSRMNPRLYDGPWAPRDDPLWRLGLSAIFANELWYSSVRPLSNGPYWSLGYEFWFYAIFAAMFYLRRGAYVAAGLVALVVGPKVLLLFPVWLLGAGVYHAGRRVKPGRSAGWALVLAPMVAYVVFRDFAGSGLLLGLTAQAMGPRGMDALGSSRSFVADYVVGGLVAVHIFGIVAVSDRLAPWLAIVERPVRYAASFTFALYLFHFPALQFFAALGTGLSHAGVARALVVGGTLAAVWVLGSFTEHKKDVVRRWLRAAFRVPDMRDAEGLRTK